MIRILKSSETNLCLLVIILAILTTFASCQHKLPDICNCKYAFYELGTLVPNDLFEFGETCELEDVAECRCVGNYCCVRENGADDWVVIRRDYVDILRGHDTLLYYPDKFTPNEIGDMDYTDLHITLYNIDDIENLKTISPMIDSLNYVSNQRISCIFFDAYPNILYLEFGFDSAYTVTMKDFHPVEIRHSIIDLSWQWEKEQNE